MKNLMPIGDTVVPYEIELEAKTRKEEEKDRRLHVENEYRHVILNVRKTVSKNIFNFLIH